MKVLLHACVVGAATCGLAAAQNDECSTATAVGLGTFAFDTAGATQSAEAWPCASGGGPDLWYTYVASTTNDILVETCGSGYDSALEVFSGSCGGLVSVACNDDACGVQSSVLISSVGVGDVYTLRVGGYFGATGAGALTVSENTGTPQTPPLTENCVETLYAANNGGSVGGAVYFDVTAVQAVDIGLILTNYGAAADTPVGVDVYATPGSHVGVEANPAAWTHVATDGGGARAAGANSPTVIELAAPFHVPAGSMGIALVAVNAGHIYSGTGTAPPAVTTYTSGDGNLTLSLGSVTNAPFAGPALEPRIWNGRLCPTAGRIGVRYCAALANSTGAPASITAFGSKDIADNNLTLTASGVPPMRFGIFLTSTDQAATPLASGTLCLGGSVVRFQDPGQILQADAAGEFSLAIDLTAIPAGVPTAVQAGETWSYQAWFRDFDPAVGATANLTDGVSISFQ